MKPKLTPSTGNVFRDVGFSRREAEHLRVRADLLIHIHEAIGRRKLTQAAAAKILGVRPQRVGELMHGRIDRFNIETLIEMLYRFGLSVTIVTTRARRRSRRAAGV